MRLMPPQMEGETQPAATYESTRTSGFTENWSAALGLAISEDLPILSRTDWASTQVESRRRQLIDNYVKSGDIPATSATYFRGDTNGLARHARDELGLDGFVTDEEFETQRQEEYGIRRDYSKSITEKAGFFGVIGQIAGYAHAMALDPVYAISMLTGYGTAATMGQAALRMAAVEGGIEAVAQVPKMSWKEEIGAEYSGSQALTEVAFAAIGAGAIGGVGKGFSNWAKKLGRPVTPEDITVGQAVEAFETMAKKNPEMEPVLNTMKHADPEEKLHKVLDTDEAYDARRVQERPIQADEKANLDIPAEEYSRVAEETFMQRQPVTEATEEGVPRGTPEAEPKPDTRHPMVKAADNEVHKISRAIEIMEECF